MAQLKQFEREIQRARSRVEVAELDNAIDALMLDLLGRLTRKEHKAFQALRLNGLMDAAPEAIVTRRALLLNLTDPQMASLVAPDVLTREESAELVLIMREICAWLRSCQAAGETGITFAHLCETADNQSIAAGERFFATYGRFPELSDLPDSVMRLPRARTLVQLADKTRTMLPSTKGEDGDQ